MWRSFSRRGVTLLGLVLAGGGAGAMNNGWDTIQVERGWSLFIAGAAALAGGAVVIAIGQIIARLDEIVANAQVRRIGERETPSAPVAKSHIRNAEVRSAEGATQPPAAAAKTPDEKLDEPVEVDRYTSGDITYVMYSDGAVEVRSGNGSQRYASLADLRAQAAQQH